MGALVGILSPFPLAFIFLQRGKQPALVLMALIFGVIWFLVGQNQALLFMAEYALMAIILGEMIRARFPGDWCIGISSLITEKNTLKNLIIFEDFNNEILKTKEMNNILLKFEAKNSLIILDNKSKEKIYKSLKNIPNVKATDVNHFNAYDILKYTKLILTATAVKELEKRYS